MSEMAQTAFDYDKALSERSDKEKNQSSSMREAVFDYSVLDEAKRVRVSVRTESIKAKIKRTAEDVIAIGQDLLAVKEELEHGQFQDWLKAEFDMSYPTANNFMNVAKRFGTDEKSLNFRDFSISVLYLLAAPSTPDTVVERVLSGEMEATLVSIKAAKEAEKRRADEAEERRAEVEQQLQRLQASVATLQRQLEETPHVTPKTVENPETEAALARLREKHAETEAKLKIKTERVAVLSAELAKHEHQDEQETYRRQVRYQFRQAYDAFHLGVNQGMARMVTPLDAASAFEGNDWARLSEVLTSLKRGVEALISLRESVSGQFVEGSVAGGN